MNVTTSRNISLRNKGTTSRSQQPLRAATLKIVGYSSEAVRIRLTLFATKLGVFISNSEAERIQWQVEAIELKVFYFIANSNWGCWANSDQNEY